MWAAMNGHTETVREMSGYSGIDMNEKDNVSIVDRDKQDSDCMWYVI
jgi:hypothetical protein